MEAQSERARLERLRQYYIEQAELNRLSIVIHPDEERMRLKFAERFELDAQAVEKRLAQLPVETDEAAEEGKRRQEEERGQREAQAKELKRLRRIVAVLLSKDKAITDAINDLADQVEFIKQNYDVLKK